jgi:hypothetical protein
VREMDEFSQQNNLKPFSCSLLRHFSLTKAPNWTITAIGFLDKVKASANFNWQIFRNVPLSKAPTLLPPFYRGDYVLCTVRL